MKVTIEVTNLRSQIIHQMGDFVNERLDEELSFSVKGSFFIQKSKGTKWDGTEHLYSKKYQTFSTGCIDVVAKVLHELEIDFDIVDKRSKPPRINPSLNFVDPNAHLRDYQQEAFDGAVKKGRGIILHATGSGKNHLITALVGHYNLSPTVIYVHTKDLLFQGKDKIESLLGIKCGQIGAGEVDIRDINVATMQTVMKAFRAKYTKYDEFDEDDETILKIQQIENIKKLVNTSKVFIVDEVHHVSCSSYKRIARESKKAYHRFGFTATLREDGDDLVIQGATGPIIHQVSASDLIRKGWLVKPRIHMYHVPANAYSGNYISLYKEHVVNNPYRNGLVINSTRQMVDKNRKVLVLVTQIKHGKLLQESIGQFCHSQFLQGKTVAEKRKTVIDDFRNNKMDALIATGLMDEGVDIPIISGLVMAGVGKSVVRAFQRIGRAIRPYDGKKDSVIVDFIDDIKYFKSHSNKRLKCYQREEEFDIKIQQK